MRMWMVDPKLLCKKHLNGEHFECHMTSGGLEKNKTVALVKTLAKQRMLELNSLWERHEALAKEMVRRGGNHKSELWFEPELYMHSLDLPNTTVDVDESLRELCRRCPDCRTRINAAGIFPDTSIPSPNGEYRKEA